MANNKIDYTKVPSTKTLAGNTIWNLIGMGLPMLIGLIALKYLPDPSRGLGREKMELLGIVWILVGFTSIFDMGLGRALTKLFADKLSMQKDDELHGLFWTAFMMIVGIGIVVGAVVMLITPLITGGKIDPVLLNEARRSFLIVALSMPIIILNVGMCGVLQACQKFRLLNMIRIPAGSYTFLSPLCVLPFTHRLDVVVLVLIAGRSVEMICYFLGCLSAMPSLRRMPVFKRSEVMDLIGFGGWMTVSNSAVSLMTFINRFIIRVVRKLGEGTFYLIPEEIVVRVLMIPRAWIDVLFPAFVTSFNSECEEPGDLFEKGMLYLLFVMAPVAVIMVIAAPLFFAFWLPEGQEYVLKSTFVVQCLTIGIFIHGFGRLAWYFVQAAGRPDMVAKLHLVELLFYLCGAYILISRYGINGAAIAWTARVSIDLVFLLVMSARFIKKPGLIMVRTCVPVLAATAIVVITVLQKSLLMMCFAGSGLLIIFYAVCWFVILTEKERTELPEFICARLRLKK